MRTDLDRTDLPERTESLENPERTGSPENPERISPEGTTAAERTEKIETEMRDPETTSRETTKTELTAETTERTERIERIVPRETRGNTTTSLRTRLWTELQSPGTTTETTTTKEETTTETWTEETTETAETTTSAGTTEATRGETTANAETTETTIETLPRTTDPPVSTRRSARRTENAELPSSGRPSRRSLPEISVSTSSSRYVSAHAGGLSHSGRPQPASRHRRQYRSQQRLLARVR